jgi:hypothetical protein
VGVKWSHTAEAKAKIAAARTGRPLPLEAQRRGRATRLRREEDLFWAKMTQPSPTACWEWLGAKDRDGYGYHWRVRRAHRTAWVLKCGPIPKGLWVLHTCDNPSCCNPAHLYLGTVQDNVRDRDERGRGGNQWTTVNI